jgi:hypothetical protein
MTIGSCTSCQSQATNIINPSDRQNTLRTRADNAEQARYEESQKAQEIFTPDPSLTLDILA